MKKILFISMLSIISFSATKGTAYTGRLDCKTLPTLLVNFSGLHIKSYCMDALQACRVQEIFDHTDPKQPLHEILNGRLQEKTSLALEICELAFLDNDPDYYERNLKRPVRKKKGLAKRKGGKTHPKHHNP